MLGIMFLYYISHHEVQQFRCQGGHQQNDDGRTGQKKKKPRRKKALPSGSSPAAKVEQNFMDSSGSKNAFKADAFLEQSRGSGTGTLSRHGHLMSFMSWTNTSQHLKANCERPTPNHTVAFPPVHFTHLRPLRHATFDTSVSRVCVSP